MKIVGVGCGPGMLTEQAAQAIQVSTVYLRFQPGHRDGEKTDPEELHRAVHQRLPEPLAVCRRTPSSSRPGTRCLPVSGTCPAKWCPGISSLQVAAARLHIPLSQIAVIVAHGRGHEKAMQETVEELRREKIVFLIADPKFDVTELVPAPRRDGALRPGKDCGLRKPRLSRRKNCR